MSPDEEIACENVKRFREEAGMTQQNVSDGAGVSIDAVRGWEQHKRSPDRASLRLLSKFFERPLDDFYMKEPPHRPPVARPVYVLKTMPGALPDLAERAREALRQLDAEHYKRVAEAEAAMAADPRLAGEAKRATRKRSAQPHQDHRAKKVH